MPDAVNSLLARLDADLGRVASPLDPQHVRAIGDRRRTRRRAAAVLVPLVVAALLAGFLLVVPRKQAVPQPITPTPRYTAVLRGVTTGVSVSVPVPAGWHAVNGNGYGLELREGNDRGIVFVLHPYRINSGIQPTTVDYLVAHGRASRIEPTTFGGKPGVAVTATAQRGSLGRDCAVPRRCQALSMSLLPVDGSYLPSPIGWLPVRSQIILTKFKELPGAVWIWTTHKHDLKATLAELKPVLDGVIITTPREWLR
jgi:hypothetical protein